MSGRVCGFEPYFDSCSRLLILGSFPSVKSRLVNFYYGNERNAFWRILCSFFGEDIPCTVQRKKEFLTLHNIALWDIVTSCRIHASADSSIKDYEVADILSVVKASRIEKIILNGGTAYDIFVKTYKDIGIPFVKLPSTSPANAKRGKEVVWYDELRRTFG